MQALVKQFDPVVTPDPSSILYEMHTCKPALVIEDVHAVVTRMQRLDIGSDDDDDLRRGLGIGLH